MTPAAAGLVNAVLRGYLREGEKMRFSPAEEQTAGYIAASYSHPEWLVETWLNIFGREETVNLCLANNSQPPVSLRVNTLKVSRDALMDKLQQEGFACERSRYSPDGIIVTDSPRAIQKTSLFKDGLLRLQDEAAQLVSYLASPAEGSSILDVCAGSGGKTTHLAALLKNTGRIVALDRDAEKLMKLKAEINRLGASVIETQTADLDHPLPASFSERFDYVLVDAPLFRNGNAQP